MINTPLPLKSTGAMHVLKGTKGNIVEDVQMAILEIL